MPDEVIGGARGMYNPNARLPGHIREMESDYAAAQSRRVGPPAALWRKPGWLKQQCIMVQADAAEAGDREAWPMPADRQTGEEEASLHP